MDEFSLVPNCIREHLLQHDAGAAAMVLDALSMSEYRPGDAITVGLALSRFAQVGIEMTGYMLRTGLKQLKALGLVAWKALYDHKRGRPVILYRLATMHAIADKLYHLAKSIGESGRDLIHDTADAITREAVSKLRYYRAALHRAFIARMPKGISWSRQSLGERLGVGGRATYNYEQFYDDIVVTPQFHTKAVTWDDLPSIPRKAQPGPVFLLTYEEIPYTPEEQEAKFGDWPLYWRPKTHRIEKRLPYCRYIVFRELQQGHTCYRVQQVSNHYQIKSEYDAYIER